MMSALFGAGGGGGRPQVRIRPKQAATALRAACGAGAEMRPNLPLHNLAGRPPVAGDPTQPHSNKLLPLTFVLTL
ncbi:MAG: hypothetical protein RML37_08910 [Chitinophagales bacterium]|nr:hypothetical protein [Chitinophagales bacterium]